MWFPSLRRMRQTPLCLSTSIVSAIIFSQPHDLRYNPLCPAVLITPSGTHPGLGARRGSAQSSLSPSFLCSHSAFKVAGFKTTVVRLG